MACLDRNLFHAVREGGFDDQAMDLLLSDLPPRAIGGACVARVKKSPLSPVFNKVARRRNSVIDFVGRDRIGGDLYGLAGFQFDEVQDGSMLTRDDREIRPDRTIQQTPPERLDDRRDSHDIYGMAFPRKEEVVRKKRNTHDVIKVGMGNENMPYPQLTLNVKDIRQASRIKDDSFVHQETRRPVSRDLPARAAKDPDFHGLPPHSTLHRSGELSYWQSPGTMYHNLDESSISIH